MRYITPYTTFVTGFYAVNHKGKRIYIEVEQCLN